jgi:hypothetical protein
MKEEAAAAQLEGCAVAAAVAAATLHRCTTPLLPMKFMTDPKQSPTMHPATTTLLLPLSGVPVSPSRVPLSPLVNPSCCLTSRVSCVKDAE